MPEREPSLPRDLALVLHHPAGEVVHEDSHPVGLMSDSLELDQEPRQIALLRLGKARGDVLLEGADLLARREKGRFRGLLEEQGMPAPVAGQQVLLRLGFANGDLPVLGSLVLAATTAAGAVLALVYAGKLMRRDAVVYGN